MEINMTRREMIEELLERLEGELDELSNAQLTSLISEYEHAQILSGVVENLSLDEELDDEDDEDEDEEELPLIDGDWDDEETEDEEE